MAGCLDDGPKYRVSGAFTAEPRPDWDEWGRVLVKYPHGDVAIAESFPEQFFVAGMRHADCEAFRVEAAALAFVASIGPCTLETPTDGDGTVSS